MRGAAGIKVKLHPAGYVIDGSGLLDISKMQFGAKPGPLINANPSVRVFKGYFLTSRGRFQWPTTADEYGDIEVSASGWIVSVQYKTSPSAGISVVFSPTGANPKNSLQHEVDVCYVEYTAPVAPAVTGSIAIKYMNPGERNFVSTV